MHYATLQTFLIHAVKTSKHSKSNSHPHQNLHHDTKNGANNKFSEFCDTACDVYGSDTLRFQVCSVAT